jgi:hypothetical protein
MNVSRSREQSDTNLAAAGLHARGPLAPSGFLSLGLGGDGLAGLGRLLTVDVCRVSIKLDPGTIEAHVCRQADETLRARCPALDTARVCFLGHCGLGTDSC